MRVVQVAGFLKRTNCSVSAIFNPLSCIQNFAFGRLAAPFHFLKHTDMAVHTLKTRILSKFCFRGCMNIY